MSHTCHAINCDVEIPPSLFMCLKHWRMVPRGNQLNIWKYFRPGQQDDKRPSEQYCIAAITAIEAVAKIEGIEVNWDHTVQVPEIQMFLDYLGKLRARS